VTQICNTVQRYFTEVIKYSKKLKRKTTTTTTIIIIIIITGYGKSPCPVFVRT
jgi:hypothetical protein